MSYNQFTGRIGNVKSGHFLHKKLWVSGRIDLEIDKKLKFYEILIFDSDFPTNGKRKVSICLFSKLDITRNFKHIINPFFNNKISGN